MKLYYTGTFHTRKMAYIVRFHDGSKFHNDGSPFFDLRSFSRKTDYLSFISALESLGFKPKSFTAN